MGIRTAVSASWRHAVTGVLAAVAGIAAGHLVAGRTNPAASPVLAVGSTVIDATPTPVKEWAVAHFGTNDKPILLGSVTLVTLLLAAAAGVLGRRRPAVAVIFVVVLAGLATAAALTRPVAAPADALAGVTAAVVGLGVLVLLFRLIAGGAARGGLRPTSPPMAAPGPGRGRADRRRRSSGPDRRRLAAAPVGRGQRLDCVHGRARCPRRRAS